MLKTQLPVQIQQAAHEADQWARIAENHENSRFTRGAPRTPVKYVPPTLFIASSPGDLARTLKQFENAIGPKVPGNKRRGAMRLYGELLAHFKHLQREGVKLPRGGNISRAMIAHGLGEVLRNEGCTVLSDDKLTKNRVERRALGKKMARIFDRILCQLDADANSAKEK